MAAIALHASTSSSMDATHRTCSLVLLVESEIIFCGPAPGLPEMLAVENAALQEYFEDGLRRCTTSILGVLTLPMVLEMFAG